MWFEELKRFDAQFEVMRQLCRLEQGMDRVKAALNVQSMTDEQAAAIFEACANAIDSYAPPQDLAPPIARGPG